MGVVPSYRLWLRSVSRARGRILRAVTAADWGHAGAFVFLGAAVVGNAVRYAAHRRSRRVEQLRRFATTHGLTFAEDARRSFRQKADPFQLFAAYDLSGFENVLTGPWQGRTVVAADFWSATERPKGLRDRTLRSPGPRARRALPPSRFHHRGHPHAGSGSGNVVSATFFSQQFPVPVVSQRRSAPGKGAMLGSGDAPLPVTVLCST